MFFELSRACEVESGMAPEGIVEPVDIAANSLVGLLAGVEDGPPDELGFQGLEERLDHGVVIASHHTRPEVRDPPLCGTTARYSGAHRPRRQGRCCLE